MPITRKLEFNMLALCPLEFFQRSKAICALPVPAAMFSPFEVA
jgi:hypothetical protein